MTITYRRCPDFVDGELGDLLEPDTAPADRQDYALLLSHSLAWIGAYNGTELIGYVNLAWDGGVHTFLLDPTVRPDYRHRGIGTRLVREALLAAADRPEIEWVHVDASTELMNHFYEPAGFRPTPAGLVWVDDVRQGRLA